MSQTRGCHRSLIMKTMIVFWAFLVLVCLETLVAEGRELEDGDQMLLDWAGYGEEKLSTVVITGRLLCDAGESTQYPSPVSGASMAVFCATSGKAKRSWARGSTDGYGEFSIDLPSHLHAIPNLEKKCLVKVMHLPKSSPCRQAFTRKHKALKLASTGQGIRTYSTHNIHLVNKSFEQRVDKNV